MEYFAADIPPQALVKFRARRGDSQWTTVWEGLTLLVAFRLWLPELGFHSSFRTKSDSLSSLIMLSKGRQSRSSSTSSPASSPLTRRSGSTGFGDWSISQASRMYRPTHCRGNTPRGQSPFPEALHKAVERQVVVDEAFWRVQLARPPREKR